MAARQVNIDTNVFAALKDSTLNVDTETLATAKDSTLFNHISCDEFLDFLVAETNFRIVDGVGTSFVFYFIS
ncbi:hypothetical protein NMY22_g8801 [Coprinellus aureogranulatus]|nr:hypothetical protein NMY22_g8801 [Coprinellus aureogranulatus]